MRLLPTGSLLQRGKGEPRCRSNGLGFLSQEQTYRLQQGSEKARLTGGAEPGRVVVPGMGAPIQHAA